MKKLFVAAAVLTAGFSAQAVEVGGMTVNGEVAFDYTSLSGGANTNTGFTAGTENEAYSLRDTTLTFSKDADVFFNGRVTARKIGADNAAAAATDSKAYSAQFDSLEIGYKVMPNLHLSFGRLQTTLGYEAIDRNANTNYSYSLAYGNIVPSFYEGVRAKYNVEGIANFTVSSYNNASKDGKMYDDRTKTKATEVAATGSVAGVTWFAGYLMGSDAGKKDLTTSSLWASYNLDTWKFALTFDGRTEKVADGATQFGQSTAARVSYGMGMHTFGLRYEMVYGAKFLGYTGNEISSIVLGDKIAINDNMKFYAEYRMDNSKEEEFFNNKGDAKKDANALTLGLVAHF